MRILPIGKGKKLRDGDDIAILSLGPIGNEVIKAIKEVESDGISIAHYDMIFLKPMDEELLHEVGKRFSRVITVENGVIKGGLGSAVLEFMADNGYASGYAEYLDAVKNGKKVLYDEEVTDEAVKTAYDELVAARNGLMKRDGNVPSVQASDGYWSLGVSPSDKYSYDKMFDGNRDTFAWFNDAQKVGKHITFTFANKVNMSGIKISAPERPGSDIIKNADIMVSEDKENWTTVGNLKMDANNLEQTFTFDKQPVKYVKLEMKEASDSWYKIAEVQFTYEQVAENTELKDLLKEAYAQDLTDKTADSVDTFLDALVEAQKAYAREDLNNEEVINALRDAMKNLKVAQKVNKAELEETVTKAEAISEETLNKAVKKARDTFVKALNDAKVVFANKDASQEEVNEATQKLKDAIKGLGVLKGDTTALDAKLAEIKKLDESKYTEESWTALMNVVAEAKGLDKENATQVEVDEVVAKLTKAVDALEVKVNKAELEKAVTKAEVISEETLNKAVKKARDAFTKALNDAKAVFENKDASQEEVNEATKKLNDAIKGLDVLKGDTTALDAKLAEIKKLDESKYTEESWTALMNVVAEAKGLDKENATQVEVDEVVAKLTKAVDALEEKVVIEPEKPTVPEKTSEKPEIKPETKPEVKPETKPEVKPETKPEDKKDDTVKTGDPTSLFGLVSAMALSLAGFVSVKKKKD